MTPDSTPVWVDGALQDSVSATTPLMSPSLHYGWGAYEGIRFYESNRGQECAALGFRVREHMERLLRSAGALEMIVPYTVAQLMDACGQLVRHVGLTEGYLRPVVLLRPGAMSVAARLEDVQVAIGCWPWTGYLQDADNGIRVRTSTWVRTGPSQIPPGVKSTGGYLNPSLAKLEAVRAGDHEAILLNAAGRIAEASAANVFAVVDGVMTTPSVDEGILPGITRDSVLKFARDLGVPTRERPIEQELLSDAEEVFLTGTAMEIVSVSHIDGQPVGGGRERPMFTRLRAVFDEVIRGHRTEYADWNLNLSDTRVATVTR